MSINGIVCYAPDPCECPDCTIAGLRAALHIEAALGLIDGKVVASEAPPLRPLAEDKEW